MLSSQLFSGLRNVGSVARRNFGVAAPALQKVSDPIQQLFLDKIREYKSKGGWVNYLAKLGEKRSDFLCFSDGKLVDATPDIQRELKQELDKLSKNYGGGEGVDMTKFPDFKFAEPKIDSINSEA